MKIVTNLDEYLPVISTANLFKNIPEDQYFQVFSFLDATVKYYEKGEYIQHLGEPFPAAGIVLDGTIEGSFISENYSRINMDHFPAGRSFGEALACVQTLHSPIQLKALTDCTVMFLDLKRLLTENVDYHQTLAINLIRILAAQNVFSNLKLRIANQKGLRDRILMYLYSLHPDAEGYLHVPFTQTALAEFLGVNRSALSRELGRMQNEDLIQMEGKKIKLLF